MKTHALDETSVSVFLSIFTLIHKFFRKIVKHKNLLKEVRQAAVLLSLENAFLMSAILSEDNFCMFSSSALLLLCV